MIFHVKNLGITTAQESVGISVITLFYCGLIYKA